VEFSPVCNARSRPSEEDENNDEQGDLVYQHIVSTCENPQMPGSAFVLQKFGKHTTTRAIPSQLPAHEMKSKIAYAGNS
jgi:hypothetical protein